MKPKVTLLTPKDLADAVGVSESALRRWADGGRIAITRTVGGHRRITLPEAIRFIRESGATVVRPELLGLSGLDGGETRPGTSSDDALFNALHAADSAVARGLITAAYLGGQGVASIFDGPVRSAMDRIGQLWQHSERGIMIEHRASAICMEVIPELRGLLPATADDAPLAIGGAPENDPYQLPTMMAAATLAEAGFRDVNFGPNTPLKLLAQEAIERKARLVWLSISAEQDAKYLRRAVNDLADSLAAHGADLILGGRFSGAYAPRTLSNVILASSMQDLSDRARAMTKSVADPTTGS